MDLSDRRRVLTRDGRAFVISEPHIDSGQRGAHIPGAAIAVDSDRAVHERLGEPIALDNPLAADLLDPSMLACRQGRRTRHENACGSERRGDCRRFLGSARKSCVHRRDGEEHGSALAQTVAAASGENRPRCRS